MRKVKILYYFLCKNMKKYGEVAIYVRFGAFLLLFHDVMTECFLKKLRKNIEMFT